MKYPILLFDLDNTILDTKANAEKALHRLSKQINFPFTDDQIAYWHELNDGLWEKLERKEIKRDDLLNTRFELYFDHFGKKVNGTKVNAAYLELFKLENILMPHAKQVLDALHQTHHIYAISNGTKEKQYSQLTHSNLLTDFDDLYLSEDLGYQKPDPNFFKIVIDKIGIDQQKMLVIGDSLTADISGANAAHLDSVWFNPKEIANQTTFEATYEIKSLEQLLSLSK